MKQTLHMLFTLLLLFVYGGVCMGQTFKKVTQQSEIVADGEYLIVYESASKAYGGISSSNYGTAVDVTISNSTISNVGDAHIVKIGGETDKWTLYDETDQKYLALTSASKGKLHSVSSATTNGATWNINPTKTTNITNSTYRLQYNTGSPRFACYVGTQKDVVLYKKEITTTTLSFGTDYDNKTITKNVGEKFSSRATLSPTLDGASITYKSSDESIATISATGEVEVLKDGTTTITADYTAENNNYTSSHAEYTLKVIDPNKTTTKLSFGEEFDGNTIEKYVNDEFTQTATLTPFVDGATINYTSSNPDVADVDDGYVATYKEGTTIITATFDGDKSHMGSTVSYTLNVVKRPAILTFSKSVYTYTQGAEKGIAIIDDNKATLSPTEAGSVIYSATGTEGLADVDESTGEVIVNTDIVGTATITATFAGNDIYKPSTASYTIEVKKAVKDGVFDFSSPELYGYEIPQKNKDKVELEENSTIVAGNVTLTNTKNGSSTTTRFYNNNGTIGLRAYTNATLTISVPEGYVVTDIKIESNATPSKLPYTIGILNQNSVDIAFSNYTQMQSMIVKYVKPESLTTAASGFATYAANYDVNYKELGLTAYAVKISSDNTKVSYTKLEDAVPANTPVLVQGASEQTVALTPASTTASSVDTDLKMSDGSIVGDGSLIYGFTTKNGVSGFYRVQNGLAVPANKGYIQLSSAPASETKFFSFDGGDGTTGIGNIENIEKQIMLDNATIYNLAGQRVSKDYKGVIIVNGKKMVNK